MYLTRTLFCVAAGLSVLSLTACGSSSTPVTAGSPPASTRTTMTTQQATLTQQATSSSIPMTAGSPPPGTQAAMTAQQTTMTTQQATSSAAPQSATGGPDLAAKGCSAIKVTDAHVLIKATVAKVDFDPGSAELDPTHSFQCSVDNPSLLIEIHPEDASKQTYDEDIAAENVPAVPLPGIGDSAVWTAVSMTPGSYTAAPDVYAHQGAITCEVQGSGQGLTIPFETGPVPAITKAHVAAFAAKLGVLCDDVFGALG